jgi:hypothetical protein
MTQENTDYKHLNLHQKLIEVMRNVRQLSKDTSVAGQYKAISEFKVTTTVAPELIRFGLTIVPVDIVDTLTETITENNGKSTINRMTSLNIKYQITNADNPSESIIVSAIGQGIGTGDKSAGIAQTYAYKALQLRVLAIGVGGDEDRLSNETTREIANIEALIQERKILFATHFKTMDEFKVWVAEKFDIAFDFKDEENLPELVEAMRKIKGGK